VQFFDASALVKRYVRERETAAVRRALGRGHVVISRLSEVEVVSALARLAREGHIPAARSEKASAAFLADMAVWHVVELTPEVTVLSRTLLARHALRAGDALQLASALRWQQITLAPLTAFVAYDSRLVEAAEKEGLRGLALEPRRAVKSSQASRPR
jgi:predicted nucleic acid-binding protein